MNGVEIIEFIINFQRPMQIHTMPTVDSFFLILVGLCVGSILRSKKRGNVLTCLTSKPIRLSCFKRSMFDNYNRTVTRTVSYSNLYVIVNYCIYFIMTQLLPSISTVCMFLRPCSCTMVLLGRVLRNGLVLLCSISILPNTPHDLAGKQCCSYVGKPTL